MMNVQQLRFILEIAYSGSLSLASKKLFVSQPGLSRVVKSVEGELGTRLFIRGKNGMQLTENGKVFCEKARKLIWQINQFQHQVSEPETVQLRICTTTSSYCLDGLIRMLQLHPAWHMECSFKEKSNYAVINDIFVGEADIGFVLLNQDNWKIAQEIFQSGRITCDILFETEICLLGKVWHPLFQPRKNITAQDLAQYNLVIYDGSAGSKQNPLENYYGDFMTLVAQQWHFRQLIRVNSRGALRDLLLRTEYLSFGLKENVRDQEKQMHLATFPLPDCLAAHPCNPTIFYCCIYRKQSRHSPVVEKFRKAMAHYYGRDFCDGSTNDPLGPIEK